MFLIAAWPTEMLLLVMEVEHCTIMQTFVSLPKFLFLYLLGVETVGPHGHLLLKSHHLATYTILPELKN